MTDFHFLRPFWLLLMLSLPVLVLTLRHMRRGDSGWSRVIPEKFLAPLMPSSSTHPHQMRSPLLPVTIGILCLSIALAGPSWRETPSPLSQPDDSLVIVLDLSLSMLATDLQPDRLTLAKRKIRDLLKARTGSLNAVIVYAGDAHVVTPLTDDARTIEAMLAALDPTIMPATGNRADLAIAKARTLLENGAPGRGRILLMTDEVPDQYFRAIDQTLDNTDITLDTLVVGTTGGGPIPLPKRGFIRDNGKIVIVRANPEALTRLAGRNGGSSHLLTLDDTDINALGLHPDNSADARNADSEHTIKRWQDDGYWLLWLVLPLLLLGWRRGAFAIIALSFLPVLPRPAQALDWDQLWQREDQRAPKLIRQDPAAAAKILENPMWRGTALYRSKAYEQAAQAFSEAQGADADYNRGNALVQAGKLKEAIKAYDRALEQNPDMADAAANRQLAEELLRQQQQQENQQNQQNQQGQQDPQDSRNQNQPSDQSGDKPGQENQGDTGQNQSEDSQSPSSSEDSGDREDKKADSPEPGQELEAGKKDQEAGESGASSAAPAPLPEVSESELTQGQEQWLRKIPDDPAGLLKRKFLQQYQQRQTPADESDTPW